MTSLLLGLRTARHLRAKQLAYLPLRRLQRTFDHRPRVVTGTIDEGRSRAFGRALRRMDMPAGALGRADTIAGGRYTWLGHAEDCGSVPWTRTVVSPLWTYHLHYFDHAVDLAWAVALRGGDPYLQPLAQQFTSWWEATRRGGGPGWDPYTTSRRIINRCRVLALAGDRLPAGLRSHLGTAIATECQWLRRRIEYHIQGNHLLTNAVALWLGSWTLTGQRAERWWRDAVSLVGECVADQFTIDGGHVERSPMYHARCLTDLLELCHAAGEADGAGPVSPAAIRRMANWLHWFVRADGGMHQFNDSAADERLDGRAVLVQAEALVGRMHPSEGPFELTPSGFGGWIDLAGGHRFVLDGGEPSPAHQPGHAHCGVFSYEYDVAGHPIVVDSGVHGYDGDPFRSYARSTRAHNTLMIDGLEQSEMWATFRVARRARVLGIRWVPGAEGTVFEGSAVHYHSHSTHHRQVDVGPAHLRIRDRVSGPAQSIESFVHFHPACDVRGEGTTWSIRSPVGQFTFAAHGYDEVRLERGVTEPPQGWHFPTFGVAVESAVLVLRQRGDETTEGSYELTHTDPVR